MKKYNYKDEVEKQDTITSNLPLKDVCFITHSLSV